MSDAEERAAFIQSIIENPADDTPRLIFADWLEEHGEADRSEFIRCQIELAAIQRLVRDKGEEFGPSAEKINGLCRRQLDLLEEHREQWFQLPSLRPGLVENMPFYWWPVAAMGSIPLRGFIAEVFCVLDDWIKYGPHIVREQPVEVVRAMPNSGPWGQSSAFSPRLVDGENRRVFWRHDDFGNNEIFDMLECDDKHPSWKRYPTKQAAADAFSAACLKLARSQVTCTTPASSPPAPSPAS